MVRAMAFIPEADIGAVWQELGSSIPDWSRLGAISRNIIISQWCVHERLVSSLPRTKNSLEKFHNFTTRCPTTSAPKYLQVRGSPTGGSKVDLDLDDMQTNRIGKKLSTISKEVEDAKNVVSARYNSKEKLKYLRDTVSHLQL